MPSRGRWMMKAKLTGAISEALFSTCDFMGFPTKPYLPMYSSPRGDFSLLRQPRIRSAENKSQEELSFSLTSCSAYFSGLRERWATCFSLCKEKLTSVFRCPPSSQSPYWILLAIFLKRIRIFGSCFPRTKNALRHDAKPTELCSIPALPFTLLQPYTTTQPVSPSPCRNRASGTPAIMSFKLLLMLETWHRASTWKIWVPSSPSHTAVK